MAGCAGGERDTVSPFEIGHVHDLVLDDDGLLVATHRGLMRLDNGSYRRIGDEVHDLMAMTRDPRGDIVAGGHPDLRLEQYRIDGAPSFLGLIRSSDEGQTWEVVDMLGEVDFHAIVTIEAGLVAGDSTGTVWRFDSARGALPVGSVPFDINDLAVSPDDDTFVVASSYDGEVAVSVDGAQTWELEPEAPQIIEVEWTATGLLGGTAEGALWSASSPTDPFERAGDVPGEVEALLVDAGRVWAAVDGGQIYRRQGDGTWTPLVRSVD